MDKVRAKGVNAGVNGIMFQSPWIRFAPVGRQSHSHKGGVFQSPWIRFAHGRLILGDRRILSVSIPVDKVRAALETMPA